MEIELLSLNIEVSLKITNQCSELENGELEIFVLQSDWSATSMGSIFSMVRLLQ